MTALLKGSSTAVFVEGAAAGSARPSRRARTAAEAGAGERQALERGIQLALERELLPRDVEVEPVKHVELSGRSAEDAADEIIGTLGEAASSGCVVVLQGKACDEKKAVVTELKYKLGQAEVWPMVTFFRAMTFMLLTFSEQTGSTLQDVLQKPEMIAAGIEMIEEMGESKSLGEMAANAESMMAMTSDASKIGENLPLSLEYGQGELINFVTSALGKVAGTGLTVLIDGEVETLRYIRSPHRFEF
uniref:Uncharacterized protein n=2 Tax=Alexandrium monilatum TaxID=311494 RepID=A0A7S4QAC4_9DINO